MNLFSAQKTNPSKSKFAKLFAIFLMCFLVGGLANNVFAQQYNSSDINRTLTPEHINTDVKLPGEGQLVGAVEIRQTAGGWGPNITGSTQGYVATFKAPGKDNKENTVYKVYTLEDTMLTSADKTRYTYKIDPKTGKGTLVPNFAKMPKDATDLALDPTTLDKNGVVGYDYAKGVYTYKNANGDIVELSPDNIRDQLEKIRKEETDPEQQKKINDAIRKSITASTAEAATRAGNQAANGDANNSSRNDMACGLFTGEDIKCWLVKSINFLLITITGWALSASGWLLDSVFQYTIVDLKRTLGDPTDPSGFYSIIKIIWGMFRDIINMSFIFLLLYASIMTIFKADTGRVKSMVKNVVIVAILINFSLFFTTTIIDVSNQLAVGMYNQITQGQGTDGSGKGNNLAAAFLNKLHLESMLTDSISVGGPNNYSKILIISVMGAVFILILSVLFFVISVLFIVRFVTLIMLMMMSPVGIAGIAVPKIGSLFGGSYWKDLLNQCFFAPIMIFFIWISVKMLDAIVKMGGMDGNVAAKFTDPNAAKAGLGGFILGFIVLVFMLIKGMEFAKLLSSAGAGAVQKGLLKYSGADRIQTAMRNAPKNIGGGIKSTAGATARQSLGWGANKISESKTLRDWAAKNAIARKALKTTYGVADAKFGGKKGYVGNQKDAIKSREDFSKKLGEKTLSELLNDQKKAKADKVFAAQTIEESKLRKTGLEERREAIQAELKPFEDKALLLEQQIKEAEAEYKAKETSSSDRHFSDSALEKKISDLKQEKDAHTTQFVAIKEPLEKEKIEIDEKLKANTEELKMALGKIDIGFDKEKHKDDDKFNEWAEKTLTEGKKVREENKEFQGKSIEELQKLHDDNKKEASAGKTRQELYAKSLSSPRIFNLGLPSDASRRSAYNIRKELSKKPEEKEKARLLSEIAKDLKGVKEPEVGGGDAKKPKDK
jgi:hypothetical protein